MEINTSRKTRIQGNKDIPGKQGYPGKQRVPKNIKKYCPSKHQGKFRKTQVHLSQLGKPIRPEIFGTLASQNKPGSADGISQIPGFGMITDTDSSPAPPAQPPPPNVSMRSPVNPCLTLGNIKGSGIPLKFSGIVYSRLRSWEKSESSKGMRIPKLFQGSQPAARNQEWDD